MMQEKKKRTYTIAHLVRMYLNILLNVIRLFIDLKALDHINMKYCIRKQPIFIRGLGSTWLEYKWQLFVALRNFETSLIFYLWCIKTASFWERYICCFALNEMAIQMTAINSSSSLLLHRMLIKIYVYPWEQDKFPVLWDLIDIHTFSLLFKRLVLVLFRIMV